MKRYPKPGTLILIAVLCLFLLAIAALIVFRPDPPPPPDPDEARIAVSVLEIAPESVPDRIVLPARAGAKADLTVSAEQSGRVTALGIQEGDQVDAGDVLVRIDDRLWRTALRHAELRLRDTQRDLERTRALRHDGAIAERELEAAETAAEAAELALEETQIQLSRCAPTAPMAGSIEKRFVDLGEYLTPGQPVARILNADPVKIVFDLPERDVARLAVGDACTVRFDALPERVVTGQVAVVAGAANPANNAFRVELSAPNPDGHIRPGMIGRATVVRGVIADAVMLPLRAVVPMEGETVVYLEMDGHAVRRIVRIGAIQNALAEIREGVRAGDRVILDGNRNVIDGTPVRVESDWAPAPMPKRP